VFHLPLVSEYTMSLPSQKHLYFMTAYLHIIFFCMSYSNGSWRSVWNIEFKEDVQMLEVRGKLQV
jgi:hypothetical protein